MRIQTSGKRRGLAIACAVAIASVGLVGAAPAQAENDFANGFEDQLGRIAAHQAVNLGVFLLSGGFYQQPVRHQRGYADPYAYGYSDPYAYRKPYRKPHRQRHVRQPYRPRRPVYRHYDHHHDDYSALQNCDSYPRQTRRHRYDDDRWDDDRWENDDD